MDDWVSLLNHTRTTPLRLVGKDWHKISSGVCYRLKVILKVVMWSNGSHRPSNDSSWGRRNFGGKGHSRTLVVKGESVLFTTSRFLSVFSLIAFLVSSISFHMLLRRLLLAPLEGSVLLKPSLLWLFSLSLFLLTLKFSSCCSCYLISCFCLVSSSILAMSA